MSCHFIFAINIMQTLWLSVCINLWGCVLPLVTYTIKYYQWMYPHVDPHVSPPTTHQDISKYIKPICTNLDHLEVFSLNRTGIANAPEGFLSYFN